MKLLKEKRAIFSIFLIISFVLLLTILCFLQLTQNKKNVEQTSAILLTQIENLIYENDKRSALLLSSTKEDYKTRAKSVSYILDRNPETVDDPEELFKIAALLKVDEIHLFDESGTIYAGTHPEYFGYSFYSGEQIGYFEPMLHDKSLVMCQDVTPNTAEGRPMMYAMCWNEAGTRMLQIGIDPVRLTADLGLSTIGDIMQGMPAYPGIILLAADKDSGEIVGSTADYPPGLTLGEIGIAPGSYLANAQVQSGEVVGKKVYFAIDEYGEQLIAVIQDKGVIHKDIPLILATVAAYLLLVISVSILFVKKLSIYAGTEEHNASTDYLTGFNNRRAYENSIEQQSGALGDNFTYVSMDLNGLKKVNDSFGHEMGDEFIKAAARCMAESFGSYGKLYRTGGDEFVAMLFAEDEYLERIRQDFEERIARESEQYTFKLSVSCAYVRAKDYPDKTLAEIAKLADMQMYEAKRAHYCSTDPDCRDCDL